jgi:outer membrane protein OmpA-like peptidoglycan-associated protein
LIVMHPSWCRLAWRRLLVTGGLMIGLAACTTALPPDKTPALGGPFNEQTRAGYVTLAGAQGSFADRDFRHFRGKATDAMLGREVWPDKVASRTLAADYRPELIAWRERLLDALEANGREQTPAEAAAAQVAFDCWLGELEGGIGINQDTACKTAFLTSLGQVEGVLTDLPEAFVVYFDVGSERLGGDARDELTAAARAVRFVQPTRVNVVGYADPTGAARANQELSERRAQAVADSLIRAGVPESAIVVEGRGAEPGVPGRQARRVEVTFGS